VVYCEGISVLLAHLKPGSVRVSEGARVSVSDQLASAGNTGNTSEPHLHIHAVRGRETDFKHIASTGEPVPMTFDGRFLVRNSRVAM
jgi:murein DD-endopeptidase MepM/ murein hydrolase activator NlpD